MGHVGARGARAARTTSVAVVAVAVVLFAAQLWVQRAIGAPWPRFALSLGPLVVAVAVIGLRRRLVGTPPSEREAGVGRVLGGAMAGQSGLALFDAVHGWAAAVWAAVIALALVAMGWRLRRELRARQHRHQAALTDADTAGSR